MNTKLLVNGKLVKGKGEEQNVLNPATGKVIAQVNEAAEEQITAAVGAASKAFAGWAGTVPKDRATLLLKLADRIEAEAQEFASLESQNCGKPLSSALNDEIPAIVDVFRFFAGACRAMHGAVAGEYLPGFTSMIRRDPIGVVASIAPWNYPLLMAAWKLGPALAAGNTVVLKPDPNTPWNATRLGRLIAEHTDIPAGVVNVVPTPSNEVAAILGTDPRVDMVSFTGSTAVGKLLMRQGADTMKRMFLELGGKSVAIVLDDANPSAILGAAVGVCVHAGQACAATTRMLVHRSLFDDALATITAAYAAVPVGDPVAPETLVGPVISAAQKERVLTAVERARRDGAEIPVGGGEVANLPEHLSGGHYVAPTVIVGVDNGAAIAQEEVFGPVLIVLPFDDDDEAVRIANDSAYGLAGAVMSRSLERGMNIARRIRTGSFGINGGMFYGADAPFGGYKNSGVGRQCGIEGFQQYLETKTLGYRLPRHRSQPVRHTMTGSNVSSATPAPDPGVGSDTATSDTLMKPNCVRFRNCVADPTICSSRSASLGTSSYV